MSSFFEKLKKGMGAEQEKKIKKESFDAAPAQEGRPLRLASSEARGSLLPERQDEEKTEPMPKPRKRRVKKEPKEETEVDKQMEQKNEIKIAASEGSEARPEERWPKDAEREKPENKKTWSQLSQSEEGQLAIDVYQTEEFLVLQSAIAGVKPESLDIVIEGDMVTIKGNREKPEESAERNYFYQECFWGPFSRQIILSVEVDPARAEAILKEGILTIKLPRIERDKKRKLVVQG